jgi:hypothetical protein
VSPRRPFARRAALLVACALLLVALVALRGGTALAQCEPYSSDCVSPGSGAQPARPSGGVSGLAFTGADLILLLGTGTAAIGTGIFIVRRTRPRSTSR